MGNSPPEIQCQIAECRVRFMKLIPISPWPLTMKAAASVFTNKYAEGYPGKRYYGGCEYADVVETLARDRAKQLFGAEHANVQPHSGSQANMAAYFSVLQPGDTILGLNLAHGGHLT